MKPTSNTVLSTSTTTILIHSVLISLSLVVASGQKSGSITIESALPPSSSSVSHIQLIEKDIIFPNVTYVRCLCLNEGIWALATVSFSNKFNDKENEIEENISWKVFKGGGGGGKRRGHGNDTTSLCFYVGQWVKSIQQVTTSALIRLNQWENEKASISSKWLLITENKEENKDHFIEIDSTFEPDKKNYLTFPEKDKFCVYDLQINSTKVHEIKIHEISTTKLSKKEINAIIPAIECNDLKINENNNNDYENPPFICDLISTPGIRVKKSIAEKNDNRVGDYDNEDDPDELDEGFAVKNQQQAEYNKFLKGDYNFMKSISKHILTKITYRLEMNKIKPLDESYNLPTTNLLRLSNSISKKLCNAISEELWNLSLGSFLLHQRTYNYLKEPYVDYSSYRRVTTALETCLSKAVPLEFIHNVTFSTPGDGNTSNHKKCEISRPSKTSTLIRLSDDEVNETEYANLPDYALSSPEHHEPLTELVWKSFVITHSYCHRFFNDFYNDFHTFTVVLLPFFTNQIMDIWLLDMNQNHNDSSQSNANFSHGNHSNFDSGNYTNSWYGGLIGDSSLIFNKLNHCYAAVRTMFSGGNGKFGYPFHLNRPFRDFKNTW